jgi:two-component system chemotaxis response regulator CheB
MNASPRRCRVVLADDSALYRHLLRRVFAADPEIEVVGVAADGAEALEMFRSASPDAVVLDINMPRMNGFEVLQAILAERPVPVFMISAGATEDGGLAVQAVARGAVDLFVKPRGTPGRPPSEELKSLVGPVKQAGLSHARPRREAPLAASRDVEPETLGARAHPSEAPGATAPSTVVPAVGGRDVIAIGASTGGIAAVLQLIKTLGASAPPIVLAQHMPVGFTGRLAQQFAQVCALDVMESGARVDLVPGRLVICASDDRHTVVRSSGHRLYVEPLEGPKEHHQRPAVDPLFRSVAEVAGPRALGVLLTGMGRDGATGLLALRKAGATTIAESEESAAIFGMPRAGIELGAAQYVLDLDGIRRALASASPMRGLAPSARSVAS